MGESNYWVGGFVAGLCGLGLSPQDASATFNKALIERALKAELGHHLDYPPGVQRPEDETNQRNGKSGKTVLTDDGPLRLDIPRDRDDGFSPILLPKDERLYNGFCLWLKRLESERFKTSPDTTDEAIVLTVQELNWLLDGFDLWRNRPHQVLTPRFVA